MAANVAIIYSSLQSESTKMLMEEIKKEYIIDFIDITKENNYNLKVYKAIGIAFDLVGGSIPIELSAFLMENMPEGRRVFYLCSYGLRKTYKYIDRIMKSKKCLVLGDYAWKKYTKSIRKLYRKSENPTEEALREAVRFYSGLVDWLIASE